MAMIRKQFEQSLHDKYDAPAKKVIADYLKKEFKVTVLANPDKYGIDLIILKGENIVGAAEVEVRQWSPVCPFPTIHVPERKAKFFTLRTLFFALTHDMERAYWIETKRIKAFPLKEVKNYKVAEGEMFFDVPTNEFVLVELI
jgi:hypothetical protein